MLHVITALFLLTGGCLLCDGLAEQSWWLGLGSLPLLAIGLYAAHWAGWFSGWGPDDDGDWIDLSDFFGGWDD